MGSKIYVGGLPYSATESEVEALFAQHGTVQSTQVITDKFTGQSRGFGFVKCRLQVKPRQPCRSQFHRNGRKNPHRQRSQTEGTSYRRIWRGPIRRKSRKK